MSLYDDALAMLKVLEYDDGYCQLCALLAPRHRADCELGHLIKKMESTPMSYRPLGTAERVQAKKDA